MPSFFQAFSLIYNSDEVTDPPSDYRGLLEPEFSGIGGISTLESNHDQLRDEGPDSVSPLAVPLMMSNAGAAALYLATHPGDTPAQVHSAMISNATTGVVTADQGEGEALIIFRDLKEVRGFQERGRPRGRIRAWWAEALGGRPSAPERVLDLDRVEAA